MVKIIICFIFADMKKIAALCLSPIVLILFFIILSFSFSLLNAKNTIYNICGLLIIIQSITGIFFYTKFLITKQNEKED